MFFCQLFYIMYVRSAVWILYTRFYISIDLNINIIPKKIQDRFISISRASTNKTKVKLLSRLFACTIALLLVASSLAALLLTELALVWYVLLVNNYIVHVVSRYYYLNAFWEKKLLDFVKIISQLASFI